MKKYLLTLLFVVATSNITLAGPYIKTLNEDIPTLSSGFLPNISGGAIEVRSTDDTYTFMSPFILYNDVENKILAVNGINEDGIVEIAKIKYTNDYASIQNVSTDKYGELHKGVYFRDELNYLNEYVFDEKIDVDFDYIFPLIEYSDGSKRNVRLVNERGETLLILPVESQEFFYSGELFYLKYSYEVSKDANYNKNYNTEIINLKTLLKDYSTRVANAKADAVNSKSTKTYNIQGMEVDDDAKGIIIENGAKYIKE